jgi:hypothetical protein
LRKDRIQIHDHILGITLKLLSIYFVKFKQFVTDATPLRRNEVVVLSSCVECGKTRRPPLVAPMIVPPKANRAAAADLVICSTAVRPDMTKPSFSPG